MLHVNVDRYHTTNRTATTNGPISLAQAAGLGKYGYGNGFTVMERISGTVLILRLSATDLKTLHIWMILSNFITITIHFPIDK